MKKTGLSVELSGAPEMLIRDNIRHALSLGLPELQPQANQLVPLTIIGSGPSCNKVQRISAPVMALNGAMQLFVTYGGVPTYWAACDPGEHVALFLRDAPEETDYFVASRCHPAVFKALAHRKVFLWHLGEPAAGTLLKDRYAIPSAASVTLCALRLARMMGFHKIETWGWDGCSDVGGITAVPQIYTGTRERVFFPDNGPVFDTTGTWLFEAQEALAVVPTMDAQIKIHGGGLFGEILKRKHVPQVSA